MGRVSCRRLRNSNFRGSNFDRLQIYCVLMAFNSALILTDSVFTSKKAFLIASRALRFRTRAFCALTHTLTHAFTRASGSSIMQGKGKGRLSIGVDGGEGRARTRGNLEGGEVG